jgi:hypothetical protein
MQPDPANDLIDEPTGSAADAEPLDGAMAWALVQYDWGTRQGEPGPGRCRAAAGSLARRIGRGARFVRAVVGRGMAVLRLRSLPHER